LKKKNVPRSEKVSIARQKNLLRPGERGGKSPRLVVLSIKKKTGPNKKIFSREKKSDLARKKKKKKRISTPKERKKNTCEKC